MSYSYDRMKKKFQVQKYEFISKGKVSDYERFGDAKRDTKIDFYRTPDCFSFVTILGGRLGTLIVLKRIL